MRKLRQHKKDPSNYDKKEIKHIIGRVYLLKNESDSNPIILVTGN